MKLLISISALVAVMFSVVAGQRPSFAGSRPIGFPDTPNRTTTTVDPLSDRFGEGTTQRLPIEANGDRDLIDRLSKLPIDKQPFWFINWQALEAHRQKPQTYPQRPSSFVDPVPLNANRFPTPNSQPFTTTEQIGPLNNRFGPTTVNNQFTAQSQSPSQFNYNTQNSLLNPNGQIYPQSQNNLNQVPSQQVIPPYQNQSPFSQNLGQFSSQNVPNSNGQSQFVANSNGQSQYVSQSVPNSNGPNQFVSQSVPNPNSPNQFVSQSVPNPNSPNQFVSQSVPNPNSPNQFVSQSVPNPNGQSQYVSQSLPNISVPVNQNNPIIPIPQGQLNPNVQIQPAGQNTQFNFTSNSSSNTAVKNNNGVVETTQNYKWNYLYNTQTHTTHYFKYPDYYVPTDKNPKKTGRDFH